MPLEMKVIEIGDTYELQREQWGGNIARISKDPDLLEEVKNIHGHILGGNIYIFVVLN